jgi:hypothetical protein
MPAYFRSSIGEFLDTHDDSIAAQLQTAYAADGYVTQYTTQTVAWNVTLPALRTTFEELLTLLPAARLWQVLLEFPLYRLRRRVDAVVLTPTCAVVIELKTRASSFEPGDKRQAEEYAQDLRDFHAGSAGLYLCPMLWALEAPGVPLVAQEPGVRLAGVGSVILAGRHDLARCLSLAAGDSAFSSAEAAIGYAKMWDEAPYRPVPSVIDAARSIFSGHNVRDIALSDAKNLGEATAAIIGIIRETQSRQEHAVVFLAGVPGAGKTLAGLNVVHAAVDSGIEAAGDIVYLSGNTPLVVVLREALATDRIQRAVADGRSLTIADARASTRATVQHVNDFLKQYVQASTVAPHEHVIVFDEAQRAWNAQQGKEKFGRDASEPLLVLEAMARHTEWSVSVCLVGQGQEINDGEEGIGGWAQAISTLASQGSARWVVHGPPAIFGPTRSLDSLGAMPEQVTRKFHDALRLDVPMRTFRSPKIGAWIERLVEGRWREAALAAGEIAYPLRLTRKLDEAKDWLRCVTRGERRMGLLASSGARRLRADGVGQLLSATDGQAIAHWYLKPPGDIRSSFALEVPANEYTCQGLEIDFACLCWGGDLVASAQTWVTRRLSGNRWNVVSRYTDRQFILNSYRVLLSRAREGLVIWVPMGSEEDHTRSPAELDLVAERLLSAGVQPL